MLDGGGLIYQGDKDEELGFRSPDQIILFSQDEDSELDLNSVLVYKIEIAAEPELEFWWQDLREIATGLEIAIGFDLAYINLKSAALSRDLMVKAELYAHLISYYGPDDFDSSPGTLTLTEAREIYAEELASLKKQEGEKECNS
jgi:hypothetical protein